MLTRPGKFRDINIGVKIIPVESHTNLSPSTNLLLRGCENDLEGAVYVISEAQRSRELVNWCEQNQLINPKIKSISTGRANSLFEDGFAAISATNIDTLIMFPGVQLGKEVGFRTVKQTMSTYNYTEAGPAHIRMLLRPNITTPKRLILITTSAFLTCLDEQYVSLRKVFLSKFKIVKMSVCNDCIDGNNTLITITADEVSSKGSLLSQMDFPCTVYPNNTVIKINLCNPLFTVAYEYHEFVNYKSRYVTFSRYVDNEPKSQNSIEIDKQVTKYGNLDSDISPAIHAYIPTNLYLNSVDCVGKSISMEIKAPVLGKSTDRMGCTIVANVRILPYVDKFLCDKFNEFITSMRDKYCSLFLVNFRGVNGLASSDIPGPRKRIPYSAAYAILGRFFDEMMDKGITGNLPRLIQERNRRDPQFERLMSNYRKNNIT
jgi:hypothetical protein